MWDYRGHADFGTVTDGGADACWSATRCATLKWRHQTYAFASGVQNDTLSGWFGQLLVGNADGGGLLYRRNRYLDASTGRFTQEDPIGIAGGLNAYAFAAGDPVNYSDPFGLCPFGNFLCKAWQSYVAWREENGRRWESTSERSSNGHCKPAALGVPADAIRFEQATGQAVGGVFHTNKGTQYVRALEKWLTKNPGASDRDLLVARSILDDLRSALKGN